MLGFDPAFGLCFVTGTDAIPEYFFEIDLIDNIEPVAAFYFEQVGGDNGV